MKNKRFYFNKKLMAFFIAYAALVTILLSSIFNALYAKEVKSLLALRENKVLEISSKAGNFLLESIDVVKMAAYTVNSMLEAGAEDEEILEYLVKETKAYQKTISGDFNGVYGSIRGKFVDGSHWTPPEDFAEKERPWYVEAVENKGDVTLVTPYLDVKTNTVMLSVCKLLPDRENVISIDVTLNDIQRSVENGMANGEWDQAMILDSHGIVVAHSNKSEIGKNWTKEEGSFGNLIMTELEANSGKYFKIEWQGEEYYVFSEKIVSDWQAVTIMDASRMLTPLKRITVVFAVMLFMLFCTLVFLYVVISRFMEREWSLKRQIKVMSDVCDEIWLINLEKNTIQVSDAVTGAVEGKTMGKPNAQYELRAYADGITDERFKKAAFAFIDLSTLPRRLKGRASVSMEFLDVKNRNCHLRFVPANWNGDGEVTDVLWLLEIEEERED